MTRYSVERPAQAVTAIGREKRTVHDARRNVSSVREYGRVGKGKRHRRRDADQPEDSDLGQARGCLAIARHPRLVKNAYVLVADDNEGLSG